MNYNNNTKKAVRQIASDAFSNDEIAKDIIIKQGDSYQVYKTFFITPYKDRWVVKSDIVGEPPEFSTAKIALSWCILTRANEFETAKQLISLDYKITYKQIDIDAGLYRLNKNLVSVEDRPIAQCRVAEDLNQKRLYQKQLLKCVETAKRIKQRQVKKYGRIHRKL